MSKKRKLTEADIQALAEHVSNILPDLSDAIAAINTGAIDFDRPANAIKWFSMVAQQAAAVTAAIAKHQEVVERREVVRRLYEQRANTPETTS